MTEYRYIRVYLSLAYLLPAFSYATIFQLPPAQNYALVALIFLIITLNKIKTINLSIIILVALNLVYILIAGMIGEFQSTLLLLAFLLFSINILLIYNLSKLTPFRPIVFNFFKHFFYINVFYCIYQNLVITLGLGDISMIHSNDPLQVAHSYVPPEYIWPLHRVTGLFNESGPFTFYLIIYSWFLYSQKSNSKLLAFTLACIVLGGSKIGVLYLACFFIVITFRAYSIYFLGILMGGFIYLVTSHRELLDILFFGRAGSIYKRFNETSESLGQNGDIAALGFNFSTKSSGALSLDLVSIISSNFGYVYLSFVLLFFCLVILKANVDSNPKTLLAVTVVIGFISNGSLLIPQYSILFIFICYFNSMRLKNTNE